MTSKVIIISLLLLMIFLKVSAKSSYDVLWYGDLHYDELIFHDQTKFKYTPGDLRNFAYYSGIWRKFFPAMLKKTKAEYADKVPFVIHTGDWIQGDSSSAEDKAAHLRKAIDVVCSGFDVPVYAVRGNHDARGEGGLEGYKKVMLPYINKLMKKELNSLNYRLEYKNDLYLFIDSLEPDYSWLEKNLAGSEKYRWRFVVSHYPVIPPPRSGWKFSGNAANAQRFLDLFLKYDVILLCGDAHEFEVVQCEKNGKRFTQLMANSILPNEWKVRTDSAVYTANTLIKRDPKAAFLKDIMVSHRSWEGAGFAVLHISNNSVAVKFFAEKGLDKPKLSEIVRKK